MVQLAHGPAPGHHGQVKAVVPPAHGPAPGQHWPVKGVVPPAHGLVKVVVPVTVAVAEGGAARACACTRSARAGEGLVPVTHSFTVDFETFGLTPRG